MNKRIITVIVPIVSTAKRLTAYVQNASRSQAARVGYPEVCRQLISVAVKLTEIVVICHPNIAGRVNGDTSWAVE